MKREPAHGVDDEYAANRASARSGGRARTFRCRRIAVDCAWASDANGPMIAV
jgi:hypothetical protein